jgi:hypothetical protein
MSALRRVSADERTCSCGPRTCARQAPRSHLEVQWQCHGNVPGRALGLHRSLRATCRQRAAPAAPRLFLVLCCASSAWRAAGRHRERIRKTESACCGNRGKRAQSGAAAVPERVRTECGCRRGCAYCLFNAAGERRCNTSVDSMSR